MPKNLLDGKPKVQLSLDLQTMADALPTAEIAVKAGVDWLEVGTPLILGEGLHAVAQLHKKYPNHPIIADLKTMDAGYLEGVDVIIVHTGLDERHWEKGKSPLDDLKKVRAAVKIPIQAVGGLSIDQAAQCPALGASLVVIGAPLAVADYELKPGADAHKLFETIQNFVHRVKGT